MRSNAVNQANSPPCIFPNVRKGFGRSFARFNTGLSMCVHRIVQNLFFRLLGHLNPIGKKGIFTVCLVGYISKAVVKEHLCADLFAVFAAYGILLYIHNLRVATQIFPASRRLPVSGLFSTCSLLPFHEIVASPGRCLFTACRG